MEKIVTSGEQDCTVQLNGTECAVVFDSCYKCFTVQNDTADDIYISINPDIAAGKDGVRRVISGAASSLDHRRDGVDTLYILGTGTVRVVASAEPGNFFKAAPAISSGGGKETVWDFSSSRGLIENVQLQNGVDGIGRNFSGSLPNRLCLYKSYSGYNTSYTDAMDFTDVKKIIVKGATTSNSDTLSTIAYCCVSANPITVIDDNWVEMNRSTGALNANPSEFEFEIDCSSITGEAYVNFAVEHGTEINSMSSYLYIDAITFVLNANSGQNIKSKNISLTFTGNPNYNIRLELYSFTEQTVKIYQNGTDWEIKLTAGYNGNIYGGVFDNNGTAEIFIHSPSDIIYLNAQFEISLFGQYDFIAETTGTVFNYSGRLITKTKTDKCYLAYFWNKNNWFVPIFVSLTNDGTEYHMYDKTTSAESPLNNASGGTFEYLGKTWYYNASNSGSYQNAKDSSGQNRYYMGTYSTNGDTADDYIAIAKDLLNICTADFLQST